MAATEPPIIPLPAAAPATTPAPAPVAVRAAEAEAPGPERLAPEPTTAEPTVVAPSVIEARIASQLAWYQRHAGYSRVWYLAVKVVQLVLAAGVPVAVAVSAATWLTASLGATIVVLEGAQQLFQWHDNWIRYRITASSIASQRSLFTARAGDYANSDPVPLLVERVEALATSETTSWAKSSQASETGSGGGAAHAA